MEDHHNFMTRDESKRSVSSTSPITPIVLESPHKPQNYHKPKFPNMLQKESITCPVTALSLLSPPSTNPIRKQEQQPKGRRRRQQQAERMEEERTTCLLVARGPWVEVVPFEYHEQGYDSNTLTNADDASNDTSANRHGKKREKVRKRHLAFGRGHESGTVHGIQQAVAGHQTHHVVNGSEKEEIKEEIGGSASSYKSNIWAFYGGRKLALARFRWSNDDDDIDEEDQYMDENYGGSSVTDISPFQSFDIISRRNNGTSITNLSREERQPYFLLSDLIWDVRLLILSHHSNHRDQNAISLNRTNNRDDRGGIVTRIMTAVGLAHNIVEICSFYEISQVQKEKQQQKRDGITISATCSGPLLHVTRLRRVVCDVHCITYSLSFFGWKDINEEKCHNLNNNSNISNHNSSLQGKDLTLVVAVGTVSNKILIWNVLDEKDGRDLLTVDDELVSSIQSRAHTSPNITTTVPIVTDSSSPAQQNQRNTSLSETSPSIQVRHRAVSHTLIGHEGVIFSCKFGKGGEYLASTSDDRTVRLWKRVAQHQSPANSNNESSFNSTKTLYQNNGCSTDYYQQTPSQAHSITTDDGRYSSVDKNNTSFDNNYTYELAWVGYGHTARVWDSAFIILPSQHSSPLPIGQSSKQEKDEDQVCNNDNNQISCTQNDHFGIITTGEDGTIRIWNFESGKEMAMLKGHGCQSIWNVCVDEDGCCFRTTPTTIENTAPLAGSGCVAITGGNDGTAKVWDLSYHTLANSSISSGNMDEKASDFGRHCYDHHQSSTCNSKKEGLPSNPTNAATNCFEKSMRTFIVPEDETVTFRFIPEKNVKDLKKGKACAGESLQDGTIFSGKEESKISSFDDQISAIASAQSKERSIINDKLPKIGKKKPKQKGKQKKIGQVIFGISFYPKTTQNRRILVASRSGMLSTLCVQTGIWTQHPNWASIDPSGSNDSLGDSKTYGAAEKIDPLHGSCIAIHPLEFTVAVGTTKGDVLICILNEIANRKAKEDVSFKIYTFSIRKYLAIQGMRWLDENNLLVFHIKGIVVWWTIPLSMSAPTKTSSSCHATGKISHPSIKTVLAMNAAGFPVGVPMSFVFDDLNEIIYIGDSRGNIAIFDLEQKKEIEKISDSEQLSSSRAVEEVAPSDFLAYVHKKEHVTSIILAQNRRSIISAGNDGFLHECTVTGDKPIRMCKSLSTPVANLSGLNRLWQITQSDKSVSTIVGGFHGNHFVLWDVSLGYQLLCVDTGGRQRQQDLFVDFSRQLPHTYPCIHDLVICITKKDEPTELRVHSIGGNSLPYRGKLPLQYSLGNPCHGETILDVAWCKTSFPGLSLLVSGSNDCTAKLSLYKNGTLSFVKDLPPHESCIRALCNSRHHGAFSSLLVVCGGKLSISFYQLDENNVNEEECSGIKVHFLCCNRLTSQSSMDHRMNAVKALPLLCDQSTITNSLFHLVLSGDSDGGLHLIVVSEEIGQRRQVSSHMLCTDGRPILSIDMVRISKHQIMACIGDTGGRVSIWLLPGIISNISEHEQRCEQYFDERLPAAPTFFYPAHQMGTNSVSAVLIDGSRKNSDYSKNVLIGSGGDDQAISVSLINLKLDYIRMKDTSNLIKMHSFIIAKEASSSALKGVRIIGDELGGYRLYAIGYDQRLGMWNVDIESLEMILTIKFVTSVPIDISDINCLDCCQIESQNDDSCEVIITGGEGMEFVSVNANLIRAAKSLQRSNYLLFSCGAGFSADSGLSTYEAMSEEYGELCNPTKLVQEPTRFQDFWVQFAKTYSETIPHEGYRIIERWCVGGGLRNLLRSYGAEASISPWWIYSSNVDGQFGQFECFKHTICEIHGRAIEFRCACGMGFDGKKERSGKIWKSWNGRVLKSSFTETCANSTFLISDEKVRHQLFSSDGIILCEQCSIPVRPNVLMFHDTDSNVLCGINAERDRYQSWEAQVEAQVENGRHLVILEIGAGIRVPAVRIESEEVLEDCLHRIRHTSNCRGSATLVRINPKNAEINNEKVGQHTISISNGAACTLLLLDQWTQII